MKKILITLGIACLVFSVVGCQKEEEAAPTEPGVEVKTMEDVGKLTPEEEAKQLRQQDSRPTEDQQEGGI